MPRKTVREGRIRRFEEVLMTAAQALCRVIKGEVVINSSITEKGRLPRERIISCGPGETPKIKEPADLDDLIRQAKTALAEAAKKDPSMFKRVDARIAKLRKTDPDLLARIESGMAAQFKAHGISPYRREKLRP
jgi:hypothetical protein